MADARISAEPEVLEVGRPLSRTLGGPSGVSRQLARLASPTSTGVCMQNESMPSEAKDLGPFYHGTKADLQPGALLNSGWAPTSAGERRPATST